MVEIQQKAIINQPKKQVYLFLSDLNNHERLMPENIYNWSSTTDEARFTIQNMAKLALKVEERTDDYILIKPMEKAPFEVELKWTLKSLNDEQTEVTYLIAADLNMMMKMLVGGQLQKLADYEVDQLQKVLTHNF